MRGRNRLSVFNGSNLSSEVALNGRPGQIVFNSTLLNGVVSPGANINPPPIINPSAVRIRISNSPFTGYAVAGGIQYQQKNPDGEWLLPISPVDGAYAYRLYTYLDESYPVPGSFYPTFPRLKLYALDQVSGTGLRFNMESAYIPGSWGYYDNSTSVEIGSFYGVIVPSTFDIVATAPCYSPPGYGTVEILEWLP